MPLDLPLQGKWNFTIDRENKNVSDLNPEEWDEITVPARWEHVGYRDYDGIAWYHRNITLPRELEGEPLVLLLGKIDDLDRTWINGVKIGETGRAEAWHGKLQGDEWERIRGYYIPDGLLKQGENDLMVQVYDAKLDGGIYEGPIGLVRQSTYTRFWKKKKEDTSTKWDFDLFNQKEQEEDREFKSNSGKGKTSSIIKETHNHRSFNKQVHSGRSALMSVPLLNRHYSK